MLTHTVLSVAITCSSAINNCWMLLMQGENRINVKMVGGWLQDLPLISYGVRDITATVGELLEILLQCIP